LDCSLKGDHCFWLGDLNYGVDLQQVDGIERSSKVHREDVLECIARQDYTTLQDADQLHREIAEERASPPRHHSLRGCHRLVT
jgi:hypothetical protein